MEFHSHKEEGKMEEKNETKSNGTKRIHGLEVVVLYYPTMECETLKNQQNCVLCGDPMVIETDGTAYLGMVERDENGEHPDRNPYDGPICRKCLEAGPEAAARRIGSETNYDREWADAVRRIPLKYWVSVDRLNSAIQKNKERRLLERENRSANST
jgi:hypothetical protein